MYVFLTLNVLFTKQATGRPGGFPRKWFCDNTDNLEGLKWQPSSGKPEEPRDPILLAAKQSRWLLQVD